jgi:hypothetical protein
MCETWSQHTWCLCSRPGFGPLKSGCDSSHTFIAQQVVENNVHELTYSGAHVKCKAYQRRWLKLLIVSTTDIPVLHSAEVVPFTHKSCYPFAKGSQLPIHLCQGDKAFIKFH